MQRCSAALYLTCVLMAGAVTPTAFAQHKVDARQMYERLLCVVPMVGKGTLDDPKRPMYAPIPSKLSAATRSGIIAFSHVISDDGKYALAEFVARDRSAFAPIISDIALASADINIKTFERGKTKQADIEAEFKKHKKDFSFEQLVVRVP